MSVLTRKILPSFFGIATIGWIIGGTIWFDKQLNTNKAGISSQISSIGSAVAEKKDVELQFQPLNLFYKLNKFRFAENTELQTYFDDLLVFLKKNPAAKLKIAAHCSDTEGVNISENRLIFFVDYLKTKRFNFQQFIFEDMKTTAMPTFVSDKQELTNQCIEIRILTP